MWKSRRSSRNQLVALSLLLLGCFFVATAAAKESTKRTSPLRRQLQNTDAADNEGVIDAKDAAAVMADDNLEEDYQFDDPSLIADHFDSKDFPDKATYNVPVNAPDDMMYALGGGVVENREDKATYNVPANAPDDMMYALGGEVVEDREDKATYNVPVNAPDDMMYALGGGVVEDREDKATYNVPANAPDDMMYALGGGVVEDREDKVPVGDKVPDVVYDDFGLDHGGGGDVAQKGDKVPVGDKVPDVVYDDFGLDHGGGGDVAQKGDKVPVGDKVPDVVYDDFGMDLGPKELPKDYDDTPVNPQPEEPMEEVPKVVYDGFDAIAPGDEKKPYDDTPVKSMPELPDGEVESDAADGTGMTEEVDVEEKAKELLIEAEEEGEETTLSSSTKAVPLMTYSAEQKKKWVAHGAIGATIFGILVPSAISSAFFRDLIPGYWIYIHVFLNVTTFALTFFTVGIAFATLNGMGDASEGHLKEAHHVVGLILLLLVSFQTASGCLRPPREFITDDVNDSTPGAIHRSESKSLTTRTLWYLSHAGCGLLIFALGTYQVHSGMGLFSKRFGTTNWGIVYLGYIFFVIIVILGGKIWMKLRERKSKKLSFEMQSSGEYNYSDDHSNDSLSFRPV